MLFLAKVIFKTLINEFLYVNKVLWQHVVLCKGTWLGMRLTIGVRRYNCSQAHFHVSRIKVSTV